MKILVLGNGFDLDHNLPTSYMNFLDFCNYVLNTSNAPSLDKLTKPQAEYIKTQKENLETFLSYIKNNPLLAYFNSRRERQGENWIDFEGEIKDIINVFKSLEIGLKQSNQYSYTTDSTHRVHKILKDLKLKHLDTQYWDENSLNSLHNTFLGAFTNFAKALEYYIATFINATPIKGISPDIIDFDAEKVITFNYSNTYERVYGGIHHSECINYIHGIASNTSLENPNIILGITSDSKGAEDRRSDYVEFEKFFQRITKKTGNEYNNWLKRERSKKGNLEIAFFGHSLDSSDSDIIKALICNKNCRITIFYYDEKAHQQIVTNLVEIIGKNKLIKFVAGSEPKIRFKKQRNHTKDDTAGVEILRDIQNLRRIYLLSNDEIKECLSKIEKKITDKEVAYFHSQNNTITLFETLRSLDIRSLDINLAQNKKFLDICKLLPFERDEKGNLKFFDPNEWYDYDFYGNKVYCKNSTLKLMKYVNISNEERFDKSALKTIYTEIPNMETPNEIKEALLQLLEEPNPTEEYWKRLYMLIENMNDYKLLDDALTLIEKEALEVSVRTKVNYFKKIYDEFKFYSHQIEMMDEAEYGSSDEYFNY